MSAIILLSDNTEAREFECDHPAKPAAEKNGSSDPAAFGRKYFAFPQGIDDDHHHIKIDARIADDQFQVIVVDNGVGIAPDQLSTLWEQLQQPRLAKAETTRCA